MATANKPEPAGRQMITAETRRRLQQQFEHGTKSAAKNDFDYATNMFTICVLGDPGNRIYVQQFLGNLHKKYNNNKKGSKFASMTAMGTRAALKKSSMQKDWGGVVKHGLELLKLNPWDVSALMSLANACDELQQHEGQLIYLKSALDVDPKDVDVNRQCGRALSKMGQFDQAIACWHRVQQAKPGDEEAQKEIGNLAVERTIHQGGYEDAESSTEVMADKAAQAERQSGAVQLTPEQQLEKAIAKSPADLSNYLELADLYTRDDRFEECEKVLTRALAASGGDVSVRERLEDTQLRRHRQQLIVAETRAENEKSPQAVELAKRMKGELNSVELEVYRNRSERYPTNLGLKYELGLRLKRAGQFNEAIQSLQIARGDTKRKALVHLELGECFQHIKQYKLAMSNYEAALETISEREVDSRKLVLYRAGKLAFGLKELDTAEKHFTELASLDFGYKDVAQYLDKIAQVRHKGDL